MENRPITSGAKSSANDSPRIEVDGERCGEGRERVLKKGRVIEEREPPLIVVHLEDAPRMGVFSRHGFRMRNQRGEGIGNRRSVQVSRLPDPLPSGWSTRFKLLRCLVLAHGGGRVPIVLSSAPSYGESRMVQLSEACSLKFCYRDLIACGETWNRLFPDGAVASAEYFPARLETWAALSSIATHILDPLVAEFGAVTLTYGFAGPALTRHIQARIAPQLDQHASFELNRRGVPVCARGGAAVDLFVAGVSATKIVNALQRLPFDRIYFYGDDRPVHISWSATPSQQMTAMVLNANGRRVPRRL